MQTFCQCQWICRMNLSSVDAVEMLLWCDGCARMADCVSVQRERGTWLFHWPSYVIQHYTAFTAEGGGAALGSAVPPGVQRHVRLQAHSDGRPWTCHSLMQIELELGQCGSHLLLKRRMFYTKTLCKTVCYLYLYHQKEKYLKYHFKTLKYAPNIFFILERHVCCACITPTSYCNLSKPLKLIFM